MQNHEVDLLLQEYYLTREVEWVHDFGLRIKGNTHQMHSLRDSIIITKLL